MRAVLTLSMSLMVGLVLGIGLVISGMIDTRAVLGFLDVTGVWKPALALVMGGGVFVAIPLFWFAKQRGQALFQAELEVPPSKVDLRLVVGAAIFGIGWGLSGICPGPGIVWLGISPSTAMPFLVAVLAGSILADFFKRKPF